MARYTGPRCRQCRREGMKLLLKGEKCTSPQCAFVKRAYPPGARPKMMRKPSNYAIQLREKQKVKRMYGLLEKQFKLYYFMATKSKAETGRLILQLLERRIDNVVFRLLFAKSRSQARQIVRHGFILVNGKKIDIPSYLIKTDDKIELRLKGNIKNTIKSNIEIASKERSVASWLFMDKENYRAEVLRLPEKEDLALPVNEQLIVELYSK